jgi:hypothetical protein
MREYVKKQHSNREKRNDALQKIREQLDMERGMNLFDCLNPSQISDILSYYNTLMIELFRK